MIFGSVFIIETVLLHYLKEMNPPDVLMTLMIIVLSLAYVIDITNNQTLNIVSVPLFLGYFFRVFLVYFDLYGRKYFILPNSGADSEFFYKQALLYVGGNHTVHSTMTTMTGVMLKIYGDNRLFIQYILMLFSIIALHIAAYIFAYLKVDYHIGTQAMYILCLIPNFAILSSIFLRESVVVMFASVSIFSFLIWLGGKSWYYLFLAVLNVLIASLFHSGIIGMALGYILALVLCDRKSRRIRFSIRLLIPAILITAALLYLYFNYSEIFFAKMLRLSTIDSVANTNAGGGSSYAAYVGDSSSLYNMIKYTPIRIIYFLGSPFLWQIRGASDIIAMLFNSSLYIIVFIRCIKYLLNNNSKYRIEIFSLFVVALMTAFVFSWGVANTGTAIRHRDKMIIIYGVLYALTGGARIKIII